MVKNPECYDHFFKYFDFEGPKSWTNYKCNSVATKDCHLRLNQAFHEKVLKNRPPFYWEKLMSVFFNFLNQSTVWFQIAIWCHETISCINFSRFGPLKIKINLFLYLTLWNISIWISNQVFDSSKTNTVNYSKRVMASWIFVRYFDFKGPKS